MVLCPCFGILRSSPPSTCWHPHIGVAPGPKSTRAWIRDKCGQPWLDSPRLPHPNTAAAPWRGPEPPNPPVCPHPAVWGLLLPPWVPISQHSRRTPVHAAPYLRAAGPPQPCFVPTAPNPPQTPHWPTPLRFSPPIFPAWSPPYPAPLPFAVGGISPPRGGFGMGSLRSLGGDPFGFFLAQPYQAEIWGGSCWLPAPPHCCRRSCSAPAGDPALGAPPSCSGKSRQPFVVFIYLFFSPYLFLNKHFCTNRCLCQLPCRLCLLCPVLL